MVERIRRGGAREIPGVRIRPQRAQGGSDATDLALRYLTLRDRTSQEILAYLERKGFCSASVREAMERLRQWGYLDDRRMASNLARDRMAQAHWGAARVAAELRARGVDAEVIQGVLKEVMTGIDEEEMAREAARKYLRSHPKSEGPRGLRRLGGFLLRRGYSGEVIDRILRQWEHASQNGQVTTPR